MKPRLVVGVGNPMTGDDGVAITVARRLARHPDLPGDVEVLVGGADLLRLHDRLRGRQRVLVLDALLDPGAAGPVVRLDPDDPALPDHESGAHALTPISALRLMRRTDPLLAAARIEVLGIPIPKARIGLGLSPEVEGVVEGVVEAVLRALRA